MESTLNKKILIAWLWVILCSISIFLIVPVAQAIQKFVSKYLGQRFFIYFVLLVLVLAFICLLYFLIFRLKVRSASNYVWLSIVTGFYAYFTLQLIRAPAEATHFLEYGLLGFFLFRALSYHVKDKSIYFTATLFALLIGTFDEILQWIIPQRMWDFRDVGLNCISGGLFQLAMWQVIKPKIISKKVGTKSIKIFTSMSMVCLIILGLCASNTPKRVSTYTKSIPWLSFLKKEEPMSEFGYKYKDPEVGVFYSRLRSENLRITDKMEGGRHAQILNKSVNKDYNQFIKKYNPITNPFLHELRVHIFRRDTYLNKGRSASNLGDKKYFYFIAYKENLILDKYFIYSIEKSAFKWNKDILQEAEAFIDKGKSYKSAVSAELITSFSEKTMWISIFALISILILINLIFPFINKKTKVTSP